MTGAGELDGSGASGAARWRRPPFGPHTLAILFVGACLIFAVVELTPQVFGHGKTMDYPLWYAVGRQVLTGGDLYHGMGRPDFAFIYPPFAAVLLTPFALFGRTISIALIVGVTALSWWASVRLSERLSGVPGEKPWWIVALPSVLSLAFIGETFNLGQPNLMLLAIMLAGLALLQAKRGWSAGVMFAAATALKAFPIAILPYLLWRRRWAAAASMALFTAAFLFLVPAPFRGFERNLAEMKTWSEGMVMSSGANGFGQRPEQNWGWKNDSIIAVTHRLVRPLNAEAEDPKAAPIYVNVLDLSYGQANLVLLAVAGLIGAAFIAVLPSERRRTPTSDGAEFALLIALMTVASPLARVYYFVWLLFPYTVLVDRAALEPDPAVRRKTAWLIGLSLVLFIVGASFVKPHWPQALGASLWATAVVIGALAWHVRRGMAPPSST